MDKLREYDPVLGRLMGWTSWPPLGAPVLIAGGAILGVSYGIAVVAGFDDWVDDKIGWK